MSNIVRRIKSREHDEWYFYLNALLEDLWNGELGMWYVIQNSIRRNSLIFTIILDPEPVKVITSFFLITHFEKLNLTVHISK
jgi:hypothetical protein